MKVDLYSDRQKELMDNVYATFRRLKTL